jgi:ribose/xylose/arabinose/galactoside ABC-type transport system permease subunit
MPIPIIVMIFVVVIGAFVLARTYFGSYVYAMGGNEEAARLAGVNVKRMKVIVFAICGFCLRDHVRSPAFQGGFRTGQHQPGYRV